MATTSTTEKQSIPEPTRDDRMAAVKWIAEYTKQVPVAWGPTASGKTYGMHKWAEEMGTECITVLLSQHTPDEVAGFQTEVGGKLIAQPPYWFLKAQALIDNGQTPVILFDELGLAREEVRGAVYTFLRDREIHGMKLNGKAYVVGAMNPATLAPPLMTRVALIDFPADRSYMMKFSRHPFAKKASEIGNLNVKGEPSFSNDPAPRPQVVHSAALGALNSINPAFHGLTEAAQALVLHALVPEAVVKELREDTLDVSVLAKRPADFRKAVDGMAAIDWHNIVDGILESLGSLTPKQKAAIMFEIVSTSYDDIAGRAEVYYSKERPEHILEHVLAVDNDKLWEIIDKNGFIKNENDELHGTAVDRWIAQRGNQEE